MKKTVLILILLLAFGFSVFGQKMTGPKLLGSLERSQFYLKDNPEGKLIVRICGSDDFSTAFVKSAFNPLAASNYNRFTQLILVPYERIFIAKSSKCVREKNFIFTQHWFVPDKNTLEYDEILPVSDIFYKDFDVDDYDVERNKYTKTAAEEKQFAENIANFVAELKKDPKAEGFIRHNSRNQTMKRNIEKVKALLEKENVGLQRVKTLIKVRMEIDRKMKLAPVKDEKRYFPVLEIVTIKGNV
jgi:hypothetical protein